MTGRPPVDPAIAHPLRVAQVVCTDLFAGVERYVATLATGLGRAGHQVVVLGGQRGSMTDTLGAEPVTWMPAANVPAATRALLAAHPFDVVHVHMTAAELAGTLASLRHRAPLVSTRHFAETRGSSAPARAVGHLVGRRIAAQLAISEYVADRIEGPSVVVSPGTPTVPVRPSSREREPVVLVAQRLETEKRTDLALGAWAASGLAADGWELHLAGDGAERGALEELAARLGVVDSCRFLGRRSDITECYLTASMLLAPRSDEPFGLSVVEAMAAGLPVVAGAGGGHDATVGACPAARLFPAGDVTRAGELLASLAADPAGRDRYGEALAAVQAERFSAEAQVAATLDVYRSVLA